MTIRTGVIQTTLSVAVLLIAAALVVAGGLRTYTVKPNPNADNVVVTVNASGQPSFSQPTAKQISDLDLVENATFTGVTRVGDDLVFTYDPSVPRGKQACPT